MNKKQIYNFIYIVLIILIVCSGVYIGIYCAELYNVKKQSELIKEDSNYENLVIEEEIKEDKDIEEKPKKTERMLKVEELQKENKDIVGWIEIENTNINYPVLQCSDNEFYMDHNYKKNKTISGSIFLDKDYNWDIPSSNLLIYGHNMKNGTMFQNLLKYKKEKYYKEHPNIRFTTNFDDSNYKIISVFESKVYYKSEKNVFKYYYFINSENEQEYNDYINNVKKLSLYDIDETAKYGEQLITLSTCAYHVKDGRFVVVAKKCKT